MINRTKIAIIRGGSGYEKELSIQSGENVIANLSPDKYIIFDVIVTSNGDWYTEGGIIEPARLLIKVDVVFNALLDSQDGLLVQKILDDFGVKSVGSNALSSAMATNKILAYDLHNSLNIKTPYREIVRKQDDLNQRAREIFGSIPSPYVVKPADGSFSFGMGVASTFDELLNAIERVLDISEAVIVEEFIVGQHVTCGVINNFREKEAYILFPAKINFEKSKYFPSYREKRVGDLLLEFSDFVSPAHKKQIEQITTDAHKVLGLSDYSTSDFIFSKNGNLYLLETNSFPPLHPESIFVKSLEASGSNLEEFLNNIIQKT